MPYEAAVQTPIPVSLYAADGLSRYTGLASAITVRVSRNSGTMGTAGGTFQAVTQAQGAFEYIPSTTEVAAGVKTLRVHCDSGSTLPFDVTVAYEDTGGYTSTRAGYLDNLNGLTLAAIVAGVWANATRTLTAISDSAGVTAIKTVTDRLATMIEQIGATGVWRFLQGALSQSPAAPTVGQIVDGIHASDYPATWPRPATSATLFLELAGTGGKSCSCKKSGCGCGSSKAGEAFLYVGDTKERVFFLRDAGGSIVALPAGLTVEIWDEDASRGEADVLVTDPSRWSGTLAIPGALWTGVGMLTPGAYWLRVLDGDGQLVTVQPLTVIDVASGGT